MSGFDVTTADLRAAQAFVSDLAGDVRGELTVLGDDVDELFSSGWTGDAATAFAGGWQGWREGALDLLEALGRMSALLAVTAQHYDGTDAYNGSDLRSAGADL